MALITIFPGLSSKANNLILILLITFASAILLVSITYVIAKGYLLFKEHQETEALVRKVWDTEARGIEDKEEEDEKHRKTTTVTNESSLIPSLPPLTVIPVPHRERRYHSSFPAILQAAALAPSFSYGSSLFIVGSRGQAVSPFRADAGNMIKCVAPDRPPLPWAGQSGWGS